MVQTVCSGMRRKRSNALRFTKGLGDGSCQGSMSAYAAKEAALSDAQDLGEVLLDAEVKLGEIERKPIPDGSSKGTFGGSEKTLPPTITKKESHQAQTIAHKRLGSYSQVRWPFL